MGGEAGVDSVLGVGSTFWFTARLQAGGAVGATPALPEAACAASEIEARLTQRAGARILVVEDNELNRAVAQGMLEVLGMNVDLAGDGQEGLARARDQAYDLVFMDMQMPIMNGLEATRAIRTLPSWADTPIVAMTANAFGEDRAACLAAGMNDFLTKPVDMQALRAVLAKWL
jgi:two-component system sensor histidine kinase/response regulator